MENPRLCLASTSIYRKELLSRLGLLFEAKKPLFDEDAEKVRISKAHTDPKAAQAPSPLKMAELLAAGKAQSLHSSDNADLITIGSDQLVSFAGRILGKTPTLETARKQLQELQGKSHELITAVCLLKKNEKILFHDRTVLTMRTLSSKEIDTYIEHDQPFDCAGTYKIEKRGISLFEKIESQDFTAIQGLPLIQLTKHLRNWGVTV